MNEPLILMVCGSGITVIDKCLFSNCADFTVHIEVLYTLFAEELDGEPESL